MAEFGTLASLLTQCHHNIIYAKIDLASKLPKPSKQRKWDYKNADVGSIRKCLFEINWERNIFHTNPNNQVELLTESILNTFSNFCPKKTVIRRFKDKAWMTNEIKQKLKEKSIKSMLKTILIQVISSCWMRKSNNQVNWSWMRRKDTLVNKENSF